MWKTRDVARILGVSERTVRTLASRGDLIAYRIGGTWRYERADVASYKEAARSARSRVRTAQGRSEEGTKRCG